MLTSRRNREFSRGAIGGDIATMSSSEDDSDDDYAGVAVGKGSESDDDDAIDASSDYCHQVVVSDDHPQWKQWDYCLDCCPVACSTFTGLDKSQRGRACQVCLYEGRPAVLKDVIVCKAHKVRVCANVPVKPSDLVEWLKKRRSVTDESLDWYADLLDATCWEKLHFYYVPNGLFPNMHQIVSNPKLIKKSGFCNPIKSSNLYLKREVHVELYTSKGYTFEGRKERIGGGSMATMR